MDKHIPPPLFASPNVSAVLSHAQENSGNAFNEVADEENNTNLSSKQKIKKNFQQKTQSEQDVAPLNLSSNFHPHNARTYIFCPKCGYWRAHDSILGEHRSCICSLLCESAICCFEGYASLMRNIPGLIYWSPVPNKLISDVITAGRLHRTRIRINSDRAMELIRNVCQIRAEVFQNSYPIEITNE